MSGTVKYTCSFCLLLLACIVLLGSGCRTTQDNRLACLKAKVQSGLQPSFESALLALLDCEGGKEALETIWGKASLEDRRRMFSILNRSERLTALPPESVFDYCVKEMLEGILEVGKGNLRACVKRLDMKITQRASHWLAKGDHCLNHEIMGALNDKLRRLMPVEEQVRYEVALAVQQENWDIGIGILELMHLSDDDEAKGLVACLEDERLSVRAMAAQELAEYDVALLKRNADKVFGLFETFFREPPLGCLVLEYPAGTKMAVIEALQNMATKEARHALVQLMSGERLSDYDNEKYRLSAARAMLERDDCDIEALVDCLSDLAQEREPSGAMGEAKDDPVEVQACDLLADLRGDKETCSDKIEELREKAVSDFWDWFEPKAKYISLNRHEMVLNVNEEARKAQVPLEKWKKMSDAEKAAALKAVQENEKQRK